MKTFVIYHGNCPDGCGAALAAWLALGDENVTYVPGYYGQPRIEVPDGSRVYMLDFSYPRTWLEDWVQNYRIEVTVLDHHATAQAELEGLSYAKFDMAKSGAVLAWEHFHPIEDVPEFILYLQDRDLWRFHLPYSREVSAALGSYPLDFRLWAEKGWHFDPFDNKMGALKWEGAACLRLKTQQVDNMARHVRWVRFDCNAPTIERIRFVPGPASGDEAACLFYLPCANATCFFSEVGERLLELHPKHPVAAYYLDRGDGKRQWGLRSRKEFDCSRIAKALGGGGHPQAAGFTQEVG